MQQDRKPLPGAKINYAHPLGYGCIAWFLFHEGGGKSYDLVSRSWGCELFNGAYMGPTGIVFDGSDDYGDMGIDIQKYCDYNKPFTISVRFKLNAFSAATYYAILESAIAHGSDFDGFGIRIGLNKMELVMRNWGANIDGYIFNTSSTQGFGTGVLYNYVITYNGRNSASTDVTIYKNGVSQAVTLASNGGAITQSIWQPSYLEGKSLWIGRRNYSTGDLPLNGSIESVQIWNRVLSPFEAMTKYQKPYGEIARNKTINIL